MRCLRGFPDVVFEVVFGVYPLASVEFYQPVCGEDGVAAMVLRFFAELPGGFYQIRERIAFWRSADILRREAEPVEDFFYTVVRGSLVPKSGSGLRLACFGVTARQSWQAIKDPSVSQTSEEADGLVASLPGMPSSQGRAVQQSRDGAYDAPADLPMPEDVLPYLPFESERNS